MQVKQEDIHPQLEPSRTILGIWTHIETQNHYSPSPSGSQSYGQRSLGEAAVDHWNGNCGSSAALPQAGQVEDKAMVKKHESEQLQTKGTGSQRQSS